MYSIEAYGKMIVDRIRTEAYAEALRQVVNRESVVLDIGTGAGIWSLLACRFGARHVYAIETSDAIQVAREIASANGYQKKIEFIQDLSTKITLREQAGIVISDLRGTLPWFKNHIPSIVDARRRLLAPGGILIPQRDVLWGTIVQAPELYSQYTIPWEDNSYSFDMRAAARIVTNTWSKRRFEPNQLLVEPQAWATLDYATIQNPNVSAEIDWTATREGIGHGIAIWFDATLIDGVGFSNAPGEPELIYGNAFFPWSEPVALNVGDIVCITIKANLVGDDYIWRWDTRVLNHGDARQIKADFKQSTFLGLALSPSRLSRRAASHVPSLNEAGQIDRSILNSMDGRSSLADIATSASSRYSDHFPTWNDALTRVGELSKRYSR